MRIFAPAPPALPLAGDTFDKRYQNQFGNVLRLYFNQISNALGSLLGLMGMQHLTAPYGSFSSTQVQTPAFVNTAQRVTFNVTDFASGMSYVAGDGLHVAVSGLYNVQFSAQIINEDVPAHDVDIWIRKGAGAAAAVDLPNTDSMVTIAGTHGGVAGYHIVAANFFVQLAAGDYIEFWWATDSVQVKLQYLAANSMAFNAPGSPSFVATISFVSQI